MLYLILGNMTIDIVSDVKLYDKDDFIFFNVTAAHVKYSIGGLKLRMNNLFDGIDSLGEFYFEYYAIKKYFIYNIVIKEDKCFYTALCHLSIAYKTKRVSFIDKLDGSVTLIAQSELFHFIMS